jgi:hypothetical protein
MAGATRGLAGRLRHGLTIPMRGGMNRGRVVTELLVFFFEFDHPQFPIYSEVVKCFQVPDLLMKFGLGCFELYHQAFRASFFFRKASSASFLSVMLQCAITRRRFSSLPSGVTTAINHCMPVEVWQAYSKLYEFLVLASTARTPSARYAASAFPARVQA